MEFIPEKKTAIEYLLEHSNQRQGKGMRIDEHRIRNWIKEHRKMEFLESFSVIPKDIQIICEKTKTTHIVIDPQGVIVHKWSPEAQKSRTKAYIYVTDGEFCYPITEPKVINSICKRKVGFKAFDKVDEKIFRLISTNKKVLSHKQRRKIDDSVPWEPETRNIPLTHRIKALLEKYGAKRVRERLEKHLDYEVTKRKVRSIAKIKSMHKSGFWGQNGTFHDYLMRRIIAEMEGHSVLLDNRANRIDVTGELDIPECSLNFSEAYGKFQDLEAYKTKDILKEICVVSFAHTASFQRQVPFNFLDSVKSYPIKKFSSFLSETILKNKEDKKVYLNPVLGSGGIASDADVIVGNEVFDLKVSKTEPAIYDICQVLSYACLAKADYGRIEKCSIANPYLGYVFSINIEDWSGESRKSFMLDFYGVEVYSKEDLADFLGKIEL